MPLLSPGTKLKLLWYLLFSAIGVFHAEVLSWSTPDVLYNPANALLVTPVYAVHYVVFGDLLLRHRQRGTGAVYLFGCLTGMYETWITKVYWSPPWNPEAFSVLGVAWIELLWIGFTWHAFMSFLIPLRLMEGLFSPRRTAPLARRDLRAVLWVAPLLGATFGFGFGIGLEVMLPALLLSFAVLLPLSGVFLVAARRWGFTDMEQLVLGRRGRGLAVGLFGAVYVGYGLLLRPEVFPLGLPLVPVLLIYAALIPLGARALRRPGGPEPAAEPAPSRRASLRYLLFYLLSSLAIVAALLAVHLTLPFALVVAAGVAVYVGAALPVGLLALVAWRTLRDGEGARALPQAE